MIKVANAPCSWGVLEFDLEGEAAGFPQVLDEIAGTGYVGTELGDWGFMPTNPKQLSQEIHSRGLTLLGAFVPVMLKDPGAHASGIKAAIRTAHGMAEAEWKIFVEGAEKVASAVKKETGLRTVFHHHCAGYVERPSEVDVLMKSTDPALLGLCFDTGHFRFGGGD